MFPINNSFDITKDKFNRFEQVKFLDDLIQK